MKCNRCRLFLFRFILVVAVLLSLEFICFLAMWMNSQTYDWLSNKNYMRIRAMLMGNEAGDQRPKYLSSPYLGYIPFPGYEKFSTQQHNTDGYRGNEVPRTKGNKMRVLCMGGSTTYGLGVNYPQLTYPAQLEKLLNTYLKTDPLLQQKTTGFEVINAGIEAGTSAEELQQYLFKYRYYKPDIVIVHSGVNDAEIMAKYDPNFQLDYTHYRRFQFHLEPLTAPARWLMKSYFFSFFTIRLFYENFYSCGTSGRECYTKQQEQTFCKWSKVNMDSVVNNDIRDNIPFYRNTATLFSTIQQDSAMLLVLPNALNLKDSFVLSNQRYKKICDYNTLLSSVLAKKNNGTVIPFTYDSITNKSDWIDDCHLNESGELNKAQLVMQFIVQKLKR